MIYKIHRTLNDVAVYIAYQKSQKLKWKLILAAVISLVTGIALLPTDFFAKFGIPLCLVVPFICLLSYREAGRKVTMPQKHSTIPGDNNDLEHLTGDLTIEFKDKEMILTFEKCDDRIAITKQEIKNVVYKHTYIFIYYKDKIFPIPNFEKIEDLKKDILSL